MISLITIIILLACVVLAFFILVQNPKGGGLSGTFGSVSSQVMGVKQSTDVMEKGTWTSMGIVAALCIVCVVFYQTPKQMTKEQQQRSSAPLETNKNQSAPAGGGQQQGGQQK
jgi:preprotein translocase subunit SecG